MIGADCSQTLVFNLHSCVDSQLCTAKHQLWIGVSDDVMHGYTPEVRIGFLGPHYETSHTEGHGNTSQKQEYKLVCMSVAVTLNWANIQNQQSLFLPCREMSSPCPSRSQPLPHSPPPPSLATHPLRPCLHLLYMAALIAQLCLTDRLTPA